MNSLVYRNDVKKAFRILFGQQITYSEAVLNYIQPSGIKSAFREQVKMIHPDQAVKEGISEDEASIKFQELYDAYRLLLEIKTGKTFRTGVDQTGTVYSHHTRPSPSPASAPVKDFYYCGTQLPNHKLRFGEFLFYSKAISWCTLIAAIVYKKKADDQKMGQYFIEQNILTERDLFRYLALQSAHNKQIEKKNT